MTDILLGLPGETKQNYKERIIYEVDTVLGFDKKVEEIENEAELSWNWEH